jgi:hypothetical protein
MPPPKYKKKLAAASKIKNDSLAKKNQKFLKTADSLVNSSKPIKKKSTKPVKHTKSIPRKRLKIENVFIKIAYNHPELQELKKSLKYLRLSFEDFLDAIDLEKFLTTGYNPKGTINELLILKDKAMVKRLRDRADGSFENLIRQATNTEVQKNKSTDWVKVNDFNVKEVVGNVANKDFNIFAFEKLKTILATNFKTLPDNKLYLDFSMVRFDEATNKLFLIIPGEIKEPKAAAELAKQFGRFVRRLKETDEISFEINGQTKKVSSKNVFYVKNNAAGIARRKDQAPNPRTGKALDNYRSEIMEIINAKFKDSRPETNASKNKQEFIRFIVSINPKISPQKIQDALIEIKTKILKIPHE